MATNVTVSTKRGKAKGVQADFDTFADTIKPLYDGLPNSAKTDALTTLSSPANFTNATALERDTALAIGLALNTVILAWVVSVILKGQG